MLSLSFLISGALAFPAFMTCELMEGKLLDGAIDPDARIMGAPITQADLMDMDGTLVEGLPTCVNAGESYKVLVSIPAGGRVLKISGDVEYLDKGQGLVECERSNRNDCLHTSRCSKTGLAGGVGYSMFLPRGSSGTKEVEFSVISQSAIQVSLIGVESRGATTEWSTPYEIPACDSDGPAQAPAPTTPKGTPPTTEDVLTADEEICYADVDFGDSITAACDNPDFDEDTCAQIGCCSWHDGRCTAADEHLAQGIDPDRVLCYYHCEDYLRAKAAVTKFYNNKFTLYIVVPSVLIAFLLCVLLGCCAWKLKRGGSSSIEGSEEDEESGPSSSKRTGKKDTPLLDAPDETVQRTKSWIDE